MRYAVPSWHLRFLHPHSLPCPSIRRLAHNSARIVVDVSQPTEPDKDGAKTLRTRHHGNKSLPLPPIIDPRAIESRQRHKTPKSRRYEGGKTDLQRALQENVYAQALASPIRQCRVTMALLPSHFMAPFVGRIDAPSMTETTDQPDPPRIRAHILPQSRELTNKPDQILSRAIYVSNSYATVERLKTKQGSRGGIADVAMTEWFAKKAGRSVGAERTSKDWLWVDDNADQMLAVLREEVSYRLKRVTRSMPISSPIDATSTGGADHVACLLKVRENTTAIQHMAHTHIFDLTALLDPASLDAVVDKQADWKTSSWIAVNKYDHSADLTLALLKLEQYILPLLE